ncbi:MAG: MarR family winged helix-turn-helix transcriptional regulator [Micropepsaceae bacterium]
MTASSSPDIHIAAGLGRIGAALRADAWQRAEIAGVTPTQAQILAHLASRGPARIGALAAALSVTQPTASDAVAALVRKSLVEKRPDPADARATRLHLTGQGLAAATAAATLPEQMRAAIGALDEAEQAGLLKSLSKMIRTLQHAGTIDPQRLCVSCAYFRPNLHADAARPHHCAFVDAAFGDAALRLDCSDHVEAGAADQAERWSRFTTDPASKTDAPLAATNGTP